MSLQNQKKLEKRSVVLHTNEQSPTQQMTRYHVLIISIVSSEPRDNNGQIEFCLHTGICC